MKSHVLFYIIYWPCFFCVLFYKLGFIKKASTFIRGLLGLRKFYKVHIIGFAKRHQIETFFHSFDLLQARQYAYAKDSQQHYHLIVEDISPRHSHQFYPEKHFIPYRENGKINQAFLNSCSVTYMVKVAEENIVAISPYKMNVLKTFASKPV